MTTQDHNMKILAILTKAVKQYPDARFGQLLFNFKVTEQHSDNLWVDEYHTKSRDTLINVLRQAEGLLGEQHGSSTSKI